MLTEPEILTITDVLLRDRGVEAVEESFKFLSTGKSGYVLVCILGVSRKESDVSNCNNTG